jgi:hypothetical protein
VHLPATLEDVVKLRGILQDVRECRSTRRDDCVSYAAAEPLGTRDFIGMEEFGKERTVNKPVPGAVGNISDDNKISLNGGLFPEGNEFIHTKAYLYCPEHAHFP